MKVAICVPTFGHPRVSFVQALGALLLNPAGDVRLFMHSKTPVSLNRNIIAKAAMEWGADHLLWLDDDQTFPEDTLQRLLSHEKAIVGCNIAMRAETPMPTAGKLIGATYQPVFTTEALAAERTVEEVDRLGLGVTLIDRKVFEAVDRPWFIEAKSPGGEYVGEDCYFFERAKAKGHVPHVDHALSWQVGHVHERALFPRDTLTR